jgi:hypothetical protein
MSSKAMIDQFVSQPALALMGMSRQEKSSAILRTERWYLKVIASTRSIPTRKLSGESDATPTLKIFRSGSNPR